MQTSPIRPRKELYSKWTIRREIIMAVHLHSDLMVIYISRLETGVQPMMWRRGMWTTGMPIMQAVMARMSLPIFLVIFYVSMLMVDYLIAFLPITHLSD